jgi:hypothetical protein
VGDVRSKRAVVAAILTLGILVLSSGTTAADGRGKGKDKGDTLRLVATTLQEENLDLGAPGPSLGDQLVFSEVLRERGREVGTSGAVCVVTEAVPPYTVLVYHCAGTLSLRRGQITLQGLVEVQGPDDPGPFVVAITGGTGAYRGAGGEAVVRDPIGPRRVYKLSFDSKHKKKHRRH